MSSSLRTTQLAIALLLAASAPAAQAAQFVYEGSLADLGQPANGRYDLRLSAYTHEQLSTMLAAPITFHAVEVKNGRFRVDVDVPITSDAVWLSAEVRPVGETVFNAISGRSKAIAAALIGQCWSTTGDSDSSPATNFIGTIDAQPFVVRTQNVQSLRIEPSAAQFGGGPSTTNTIAGSSANAVTAGVRGATIAGGGVPIGNSDPDFVREAPNRVTDSYGTIGGGYANRAGDDAGTTTDRAFATVGGGHENTASGEESTVSGGVKNVASGNLSVVVGGENNLAIGARSTVGGGTSNCAGGNASWAGGSVARVRPGVDPGAGSCSGLTYPGGTGDQGTFAWADSQSTIFASTGDNQFLVRAAGGMYFGRVGPVSIPSDRFINTSTGAHLTTGGSWTNASSRALKTDFAAIDPTDVLDRVTRMGISSWAYRASSEGRHLGPVAEEFHELFGLGSDGSTISTVDASGVALAAIQGLNQKLEAENTELRARLDRLEARLSEHNDGAQ